MGFYCTYIRIYTCNAHMYRTLAFMCSILCLYTYIHYIYTVYLNYMYTLTLFRVLYIVRIVCCQVSHCTQAILVSTGHTVESVFQDHSRDHVRVVSVDRWSLCRGAAVLI